MHPSGKHQLAAIRYPSVVQADRKESHTVVMCNAHRARGTRAHRPLQQLAVRLSQAGFDVVRFEFACTGNSTGEAMRELSSSGEPISNLSLALFVRSLATVQNRWLGSDSVLPSWHRQTKRDRSRHPLGSGSSGLQYWNELQRLHRYHSRA